jgi:hypothetical protein
MAGLIRIPYVDLRGSFGPLDLVYLRRKQACALLEAVKNTFGAASRSSSAALLRIADRASRRWLEKADNPYCWEIGRIAEEVGETGAFTMNVCLEWGCTSGVWQSESGPILRRTLDWPIPTLGEQIVVLHLTGKAGTYFNITWPGLSGVFQGLAQGRFAAAINQAPMRRTGAGLVGDWALGRIAVGRNAGLPPSHLLRQVFEIAPDYVTAKSLLCRTELAVPAIFILAGVNDGEACIIERTENDFTVRETAYGHVCTANHFVKPPEGGAESWRARPIDSVGRLAQAEALPNEGGNFFWFLPPIANENCRLALAARPRQGRLSLMGTAGTTPVTEIFRLPQE